MITSTAFTLLASFSALVAVRGDAIPTSPGPGDVFNQGSMCRTSWIGDADGNWADMKIQLMTGDNFNMIEVATVATGLNGNQGGTFEFKCPKVEPYSAIYFFQYTAPGRYPTWATRFTIADKNGNSTPPPESTQPDGAAIPWGVGRLAGDSNPPPPVTTSTSTTSSESSTSTSTTSSSAATGTTITTTASSSRTSDTNSSESQSESGTVSAITSPTTPTTGVGSSRTTSGANLAGTSAAVGGTPTGNGATGAVDPVTGKTTLNNPGQAGSGSNGQAGTGNGDANGNTNGNTNGSTNGGSNGSTNGSTSGSANGSNNSGNNDNTNSGTNANGGNNDNGALSMVKAGSASWTFLFIASVFALLL
ncbi:hypothetical protein PQX77_008390 [Marasmius sp. AFHP31]|nr:hypothetical protein PQX77_013003 [Marasmius sp. AFHP31]KAK1228525.1 hypothetical protein PQX77_008390 [Marasmius sp. AFHP31]